jgi:hypothetical protein
MGWTLLHATAGAQTIAAPSNFLWHCSCNRGKWGASSCPALPVDVLQYKWQSQKQAPATPATPVPCCCPTRSHHGSCQPFSGHLPALSNQAQDP